MTARKTEARASVRATARAADKHAFALSDAAQACHEGVTCHVPSVDAVDIHRKVTALPQLACEAGDAFEVAGDAWEEAGDNEKAENRRTLAVHWYAIGSASIQRRGSGSTREVVEPDGRGRGTEHNEPNAADAIVPRSLREVVAAHEGDDVADVVLPSVGRVVGEHGAERELQVVLDQLEADLRAESDRSREAGELHDGARRGMGDAEAIEEALIGTQRRRSHPLTLAEETADER